MDDKELNAFVMDWLNWCYTRRFYIPPGAQNILARMQPSKTGRPPNAPNNPLMQYFNMAIHAMADMSEHKEGFACFSFYYIEQGDCVKRRASELGISRPTYYNRTRAFVRQAYSLAQSLKKASEQMRERVPESID